MKVSKPSIWQNLKDPRTRIMLMLFVFVVGTGFFFQTINANKEVSLEHLSQNMAKYSNNKVTVTGDIEYIGLERYTIGQLPLTKVDGL